MVIQFIVSRYLCFVTAALPRFCISDFPSFYLRVATPRTPGSNAAVAVTLLYGPYASTTACCRTAFFHILFLYACCCLCRICTLANVYYRLRCTRYFHPDGQPRDCTTSPKTRATGAAGHADCCGYTAGYMIVVDRVVAAPLRAPCRYI